MKLKTISGTNFQGATFDLELGDLNLLYGGNMQGKTRIKRAIELALLGYLPAVPKPEKTNAAIFALSSGDVLGVRAVLDSGHVINRMWREERGGTIKKTESGAVDVPLVMLDAFDYFNRSARGRVELVASLANIKDEALDIPEDIAATLRTCEAGWNVQSAESMQDLIEKALAGVEEARSRTAEEVRRYTGTLQGVSALQLADKPATRDIRDIDAEIEAEQTKAAKERAVVSILERDARISATAELERERLQHQIEEAGDPPAREFDINALRSREKDLKERKARASAVALAKQLWEARREKRNADIRELRDQLRNTRSELTRLTKKKIFKKDFKPSDECCHECGRPFAENVNDWLKHEKEMLAREIEITQGQITSLEERLREFETPDVELPPGKDELMDVDENVIEAELLSVLDDIDTYTQTADVQVWRKQLAGLPEPVNHATEIETLNASAQKRSERIIELKVERQLAESDRQDRKRLAQAQEELERARAAETRHKDAKKWLLETKAKLIEQVFGPLLETVKAFTTGIFKYPVEYRDGVLGKFDEETGRTWVTESTFSGAEGAILRAALQTALGAQSPCRIIVMDELANFETDTLHKFLENVWSAQKRGIIEQFIGLLPVNNFPSSLLGKGFTLIRAGGNTYVTE